MPSFPGVDILIALHKTRGGTEIDLFVSPNSDRSEIVGFDVWRKRIPVKLRSPPEKGEANAELEGLLTERLGNEAKVIRGYTTRMKTVFVRISMDETARRLGGSP